MCKPNKSLRMTVRAFIKAEEKKKIAAAEAAEAAAAAAAEQEEAAAQRSEQIAEQSQAEPEIQTEPDVERPQEDNAASEDATEGALAPEATDPLAQVEEVRLCEVDGRNDILTCIYRYLSAQLERKLEKRIRPNNRLEPRKTLLHSQSRRLTLISSERMNPKVNNKTRTDKTLLSKTFRIWTGTPLMDSTP